MYNLQLIDSVNGGDFYFDRNDYQIDQGLYTEIYIALFSTEQTEWLGDNVEGLDTYNIASATENALKTNNFNIESEIAQIRKAIQSDFNKFANKNKNIELNSITIKVFDSKTLEINLFIEGFSDPYKYIYAETVKSLENLSYKEY